MYTMVMVTAFHGKKLINNIHSITTVAKQHQPSNVFHPVTMKQGHLRWAYSGCMTEAMTKLKTEPVF
jgi:hypothetical protein